MKRNWWKTGERKGKWKEKCIRSKGMRKRRGRVKKWSRKSRERKVNDIKRSERRK